MQGHISPNEMTRYLVLNGITEGNNFIGDNLGALFLRKSNWEWSVMLQDCENVIGQI